MEQASISEVMSMLNVDATQTATSRLGCSHAHYSCLIAQFAQSSGQGGKRGPVVVKYAL